MRPYLCAIAMPLLLAGTLAAQDSTAPRPLTWVAVPPILAPGAQIAIVSGDPTAPGPVTIELLMPDGYRMPPHSHPGDEHVEVLQGTLLIGLGNKLDPKRTMPAQVGDTGTAPAGQPHFTIAKGVTRVRVTFTGPYTITYVNTYEVPRQPAFPIGY